MLFYFINFQDDYLVVLRGSFLKDNYNSLGTVDELMFESANIPKMIHVPGDNFASAHIPTMQLAPGVIKKVVQQLQNVSPQQNQPPSQSNVKPQNIK